MKIKPGALVQDLPAKVGYYIVLEKRKMDNEYIGRTGYWALHTIASANYHYSGPRSAEYMCVVMTGG